ncbi:hypothetical protein CI109_101112 [Kwoniella shandongensis]|uniref:Uncharacterized protein n=1 Tax=Kwoniella shandongensis TaxID=1734106 RepID=A0A5M6C4W3_9TREE|nr:uncharacterized protein CI109_001582 [Kwoniella shandongensis]KAA5530176.1 hypothetical protein CI109_001582 [Kwoniella shandongensis]
MSRIAPTTLLRNATIARSSLPCGRGRPLLRSALAVTRPLPPFGRYQSTVPPNSQSKTEANAESKKPIAEGDAEAAGPAWKKGLRVSWIFSGLIGFGALVTIYGLLEFYSTLTTWPKAVRKPLRAALKSKLRQDYNKAEAFFREALFTALEIGPNELQPDPLLKISGIYVELANVLEIKGQRVAAYTELDKALKMFGPDPLAPAYQRSSAKNGAGSDAWIGEGYVLSEKDHIRSIGLSQKLGQLALEIASSSTQSFSTTSLGPKYKTWDEAAESHLSSALTAMLHLGLNANTTAPGTGGQVILGRDVNLPDSPEPTEEDSQEGGRVDKRGLGMTMESLSEVYARKKQFDMAAQLLLQATSLLLPPGSKETPPLRDRCQAAMLMTTISSHALHPHPSSAKSLKVSKSWSLRSLQLSQQALSESSADGESVNKGTPTTPTEAALGVCMRAKAVGLHNLGMLAEMENDLPTALNYFNKSLSASRETGFVEGKREAMSAIRRIQGVRGDTPVEL